MNYDATGYVYAITNKVNGNRYIGSTITPSRRWVKHRYLLRKNAHHSFVLQAAWNKHTEAAFDFSILLVCPAGLRTDYEEQLMPSAAYNIVRTKLQKLFSGPKIAAALRGKPKTLAHCLAISQGKLGVKRDTAFCETAKRRQLGVPVSMEAKGKLSVKTTMHRAPEVARNKAASLRIYSEYTYGQSISTLCAAAEISTSTFYNYCVGAGLPSVKKVAVARLVQRVAQLVSEGCSISNACGTLKIKYGTFRALIARRGQVAYV
jgi:hypothetical protein